MAITTRLGFRNRPIHPDYAIGQQISKSLRSSRSYQRQHVPLVGSYQWDQSPTAGSFTPYSLVPLMPGDTIVSAVVAVTVMTGGTYDVEINTVLEGANLGGPWTLAPNYINIGPYAKPFASAGNSRLFARLKNTGAGTITQVDFQLQIVVLR